MKSSFPCSETPIFLLESCPCHTKCMCINIRAFQKDHKYHVSGSRSKNYKKKKHGTRKGAVSAGYLVCCLVFVVCSLLFVLCCLFSVVCSLLFVGPLFFVVRCSFFVVVVLVLVVIVVAVVVFFFVFFLFYVL